MNAALSEVFDAKMNSRKSDSPSVLRKVEGYTTFFNKVNRNKRKYSRSFWESVMQSDYVKEKLGTKTLWGELKHNTKAGESDQVDHDNVAHCIYDYKIDDVGVYCYIDILNTDHGKVLATLLDYGSHLGVSTRAFGEEIKDSVGHFEPNPDTYYFVTWDFVSFPAFPDARMSLHDSAEINGGVGTRQLINDMKEMSSVQRGILCDCLQLDLKEVEAVINPEKAQLEQALGRLSALENKFDNYTVVEEESLRVRRSKTPIYDSGIGEEFIKVKDELALTKDLLNLSHEDLEKAEAALIEANTALAEIKSTSKEEVVEIKEIPAVSTDPIQQATEIIDSYIAGYSKPSINDSFRAKEEINVSVLQARIESLQESLRTAERASERSKTIQLQLDSYKEVYSSHQLVIEELNAAVEEKQAELDALKSYRDDVDEVVEKTERLLELNRNLKEENESLKEESRLALEAVTLAESQIEELKVELESVKESKSRLLSDENSKTLENYKKLQKRVRFLKTHAEEKQELLDAMKTELERLTTVSKETEIKYINESKSLRAKNLELKATIQELQDSLADTKVEANEAKKHITKPSYKMVMDKSQIPTNKKLKDQPLFDSLNVDEGKETKSGETSLDKLLGKVCINKK